MQLSDMHLSGVHCNSVPVCHTRWPKNMRRSRLIFLDWDSYKLLKSSYITLE